MTAKSFDPTLKDLVETDPESWPRLLGQPVAPTTVIDADIATVTGAGCGTYFGSQRARQSCISQ
jgi:hypothetical protein